MLRRTFFLVVAAAALACSPGTSGRAPASSTPGDGAATSSVPDSASSANSTMQHPNNASAIGGIDWTLVALDGVAIENAGGGKTPTLKITSDSSGARAVGVAGCNRFSGPVTQDGDSIRFGPLAATKMACPAMQLESKYFAALDQARTIRASQKELELLAGEVVLARFVAP